MNTGNLFPISLNAIVLECKDVAALSNFYIRLLGWQKNYEEDNVWVDIVAPSGGVKIGFLENEDYVPPVWPDEPGKQQQMVHLDFIVKSEEQRKLAVNHAIECGASKAAVQYCESEWTTMIDPAGHPFCFVIFH